MIPEVPANHRASIDADGNIILPGTPLFNEKHSEQEQEVDQSIMQEGKWYSPDMEVDFQMPWMQVEDTDQNNTGSLLFENEMLFDEEEKILESEQENTSPDPILAMLAAGDDTFVLQPIDKTTSHMWQAVRGKVYEVTNDVLAESGRQYQASIIGGMHTGRGVQQVCKDGVNAVWRFLTQPVWVPGRHNQPKQYGRGVLFALDIVRFGGTFASLFVVLFVSLNFQSFWSIAHSYIDPLADITAGKDLSDDVHKGLADKLKRIPSLTTAGSSDGEMAAFLPEVGPPDNRLIIPKMNLNVPIVVPPNSNLLKEDWKALEEDIQYGLQDGVVHYPGTARPGQAGNFFVTGHSSYFPWAPGNFKSIFARLGDLNVGDEYWVYYGGDKYRYIITDKTEIKPSDVSVLDQPVSKRISSLMTCTPIGTTLRRLILTAQEVNPLTGIPMTVGEHQHGKSAPAIKMEMLPI